MTDGPLEIVLVSASDCHLCDHAREVLAAISPDIPLAVREVRWPSEEAGALVGRDGVPFPPALYASVSLLGYGRLAE